MSSTETPDPLKVWTTFVRNDCLEKPFYLWRALRSITNRAKKKLVLIFTVHNSWCIVLYNSQNPKRILKSQQDTLVPAIGGENSEKDATMEVADPQSVRSDDDYMVLPGYFPSASTESRSRPQGLGSICNGSFETGFSQSRMVRLMRSLSLPVVNSEEKLRLDQRTSWAVLTFPKMEIGAKLEGLTNWPMTTKNLQHWDPPIGRSIV